MGKHLVFVSFLAGVILFCGFGCVSKNTEELTSADRRLEWINTKTLSELKSGNHMAILWPGTFGKVLKTINVGQGLKVSDVLTKLPDSNFFNDNEFWVITEKAILRRALPWSTDAADVERNKNLGKVLLYPGDLVLLQGIE